MNRQCLSLLSVFLSGPLYADRATWVGTGDGASWEDPDNWSWTSDVVPVPEDYPGSATSPGDVNVQIASPNGVDLAVSLTEALNTTTVLRDLRFDAGPNGSVLDVNLLEGSQVIATQVGNTLLTINEGGSNGADCIARLNVAGSLTVGQIRMSRDADGPHSELNILPEGDLIMTGGGQFVMRNEVATGTSIFRMTGGSFSSGGNRNLEMGSFDSQVHLSGNAVFDGENLTLKAHVAGASHSDKTSLISVSGSEIQLIAFKAIEGWNAASNPDGTSTFQFITDGDGVTPIMVFGDTDLAGDAGGGDKPADLIVDLTNYPGADDLVLFDLSSGTGTVMGEFGEITLVSGTGDIDYGYNGGTQIALTNIIKTAGPLPTGLVITSIEVDGSDVVLVWNDSSPNEYSLESSTDLSAGSWTLVSPTAANGTFTDTGALSAGPNRFYRLRENP